MAGGDRGEVELGGVAGLPAEAGAVGSPADQCSKQLVLALVVLVLILLRLVGLL